MSKNNDLEELIRLSHIVARPYAVAVWVLSVLLLISVGANVYLATIENEVIIEQENNHADFNLNGMNNDVK